MREHAIDHLLKRGLNLLRGKGRHYPYPELLSFLKIETTPAEYQRIRAHPYPGVYVLIPASDAEYWQLVPRHKYAECPFCGMEYIEPADPYALVGWDTQNSEYTAIGEPRSTYIAYKTLYVDKTFPLPARCPHLLCVDRFVNLHGQRPPVWSAVDGSQEAQTGARRWSNFTNHRGEVPVITPWFLPESVSSCVVVHSLALCGITKKQFAPRYTAFALTYFSENPQQVLYLRHQAEVEIARRDPEYYAPRFWPAPPYPRYKTKPGSTTFHDLDAWARRGKLGWLDITQPGLPLRRGPEHPLPLMYRHITGIELPYSWEGRILKIDKGIW